MKGSLMNALGSIHEIGLTAIAVVGTIVLANAFPLVWYFLLASAAVSFVPEGLKMVKGVVA